jgi:hypothetical protein
VSLEWMYDKINSLDKIAGNLCGFYAERKSIYEI